MELTDTHLIETNPYGGHSRILEAIESLPDDEREAFDLVRIQGMTHPDAATVMGVSVKTVQRRLNRSLLLLADKISDLQPPQVAPR